MRIFDNPNYDFIKWRWQALALSLLIIAAGAGVMLTRGMNLGIDFSGGTIVIVRFAQPVQQDAVRSALDVVPGEKVVKTYGAPSEPQILTRLPLVEASEQGTSLEQGARQVVEALQKANVGQFD